MFGANGLNTFYARYSVYYTILTYDFFLPSMVVKVLRKTHVGRPAALL